MTLIPVVSAVGECYPLFIVLPGVQQPFRRLTNGRIQTVHDYFPNCAVFHRDTAGVDTSIFVQRSRLFAEQTAHLRTNGRYIIVIYDGYVAHMTPIVLRFFQKQRIIAVSLPSHTSHRLQPLDFGLFGPFKNMLQDDFHKAAHRVKKIK